MIDTQSATVIYNELTDLLAEESQSMTKVVHDRLVGTRTNAGRLVVALSDRAVEEGQEDG